MRLEDMGEDGITELLAGKYGTTAPDVIRGIGDDTAVLRTSADKVLLATTDTLIEDIHFTRELITPYLLGSKALAVSLSDIAAMGGEALFYLVTLNLPSGTEMSYLKNLYQGLNKQAQKFGVALTGGNISRSESISITTTVLGEIPADEVVYRDGAIHGDDIYITGHPGDSALGLKILEKHGGIAITNGPLKRQVKKHLEPLARIKTGRELARKKAATAMMDISDGLLLDLGRLCKASRAGALIEAHKLPLSRGLRQSGPNALRTALTGGEDYELLFTARPANAGVVRAIGQAQGTRITKIGRVRETSMGLTVEDKDGIKIKIDKISGGYRHF